MLEYFILFLISCILALILTPLLRNIAVKKRLLDQPNERKLHTEAVPRIGGVAISVSFFVTILISYIFFRADIQKNALILIGLFVGALIISVWGLWDDLQGMKARKKSYGQLICVLAFLPFGLIIRGFSIPYVSNFVEIGLWLGIPLTFFWVIGIINTINFIDGMDGLAAGTSIIITLGLLVISLATGQMFMAAVCLILAGSIIGFLRYNFHPASIFMGDCGAMFLGFILGAISIEIVFHNRSLTASSVVPVLLFGLPILDSSWAIIRRIVKGQSPTHADNLHTHHRLMNLGLTQHQAVSILYAANLLSVTGGVIVALAGSEKLAIVVPIIMLIIAGIGIIFLNRLSKDSLEEK